ncbi:MAG TPA: PLP-dependent aminotransferase family protein [Candidatus Anaerostipes avistercoris]|uniref:PLP-dependent aminotransferase family protein n=1 Tax=Candidatus Anaerostipes avistercoris TaxID=2838462 RepID=A0A9D2PKV9_9FIRM|nr:PLP-dependent aminotransferase family protein [Candidatus Anaerostipes avistercoris]
MLMIELEDNEKEPLYEQIYEQIKHQIQMGDLPQKTKLPSARKLAAYLDVSRNTVDFAYGQLAAEGYIESRPRSGFYVCQVEELAALDIHVETEEVRGGEKKAQMPYDFSPSGTDMEYFPYHVWRKLLKEIMINDNSELFQKGDPRGDYELRRSIMYYLRQSRGVHVHASQIVIGAGMENLLFLLRQTFGKKCVVGLENPVYTNACGILRELGFGIRPVAMDHNGLNVDDLRKIDADLAYVTPAHQYPTGVIMPAGRRGQLLRWAREKEERYIIEDDYDSEFRYHGKPIPALQGLDSSEKVIYMGTFSRAIAPAIRVGYIVLPPKLLDLYHKNVTAFSCSVSRIDQKVLTLFLSEGHFERHLNRMRNLYKEKHDLLLECIRKNIPGASVSGEGAGVHLIVNFHIREKEEFEQKLRQQGVVIYPLSFYYIEGTPREEQYILGFTRMKKEDMIEGTRRIGNILSMIK